MAEQANRIEVYNGVKCFLWKTVIHPFNTNNRFVDACLTPLFSIYGWYPNRTLDDILRSAGTIIVESGLSIALIPRIRRINPSARLIYRASDRLSAIGQHRVLTKILQKHQAEFDSFCLLGPGIAVDFAWAYPNVFVVPPAFNPDRVHTSDTSPFDGPINAVSLGAMLFDESFFGLAGPMFPDVTFHIFGVQAPANTPENVRYYPDIAYAETWHYIRHATFGIAPYRAKAEAEYIADTSSKLMQYGVMGLPSVCPHFAVGRHPHRIGYTPGDAGSIEAAVKLALVTPHQTGNPYRVWSDIVPRLLAPREYPDTLLSRSAAKADDVASLSLIVATLGRVEPLARLLSSLRQQSRDMFEVIVVDQNAPGHLDGLLEGFAADLNLIHLRSPPGLSLARNVGLAVSRGRFVGFPDDDCWYPADRVAEIVRFFETYPEIDILLGQTVDQDGIASVTPTRAAGDPVTPANVWFSGNSNTLFLRQPLACTLRFDESLGVGARSPFQSGEETDLILRGLRTGAHAMYCPNLTIYHEQVDRKLGRFHLRRAWRYSTGFGQILRRHYRWPYVGYRVLRSLVSAIVAMARGTWRLSVYRLVWAAGTIRGCLKPAP